MGGCTEEPCVFEAVALVGGYDIPPFACKEKGGLCDILADARSSRVQRRTLHPREGACLVSV